MNKPQYIIWKDGYYFQTRAEYPSGSGEWHDIFTVYHYDAARIDDLETAKECVKRMAESGESWKIYQFFRTSGGKAVVWKYQAA